MGLAPVVFSPALGTCTPAVGFEKKLFTRTPLPAPFQSSSWLRSVPLAGGRPSHSYGASLFHPSIHTTPDRLTVVVARL